LGEVSVVFAMRFTFYVPHYVILGSCLRSLTLNESLILSSLIRVESTVRQLWGEVNPVLPIASIVVRHGVCLKIQPLRKRA